MSELLRKESFNVVMPKKIKIGDPYYFEQFQEDKQKLNKLTYNATFRGKEKWVGKMHVIEEKLVDDSMGISSTFNAVRFICVFAEDEKLADLLLENKIYKGQKVSSIAIGVDTAEYEVAIDDRYLEFHTGADGYWGDVYEIYNGSKKVGITIALNLPDLSSFEENLSKLKYLFAL